MKLTDLRSRPNIEARLHKHVSRITRYNDMMEDEEERHRLQVKNIEIHRKEYAGYMAEFLGVDLTPDQMLDSLDIASGEIAGVTVEEVLASHKEEVQ